MNKIQIRKANLADVDAITYLVNRAYRPAPGSGGWTHESGLVSGRRVDSQAVASAIECSTVMVCHREQALIGCVHIEVEGDIAQIGMLAVDPTVQAGGVGKYLLEQAEKFAIDYYAAKVVQMVVIAARKELLAFYVRRGYKQTSEQLSYPDDAGVGAPVEEAKLLVRLQKNL